MSIKALSSEKLEFIEFQKMILSFFAESNLSYIINNDKINNNFSPYFKDMSKEKLWSLNFEFSIPEDIFKVEKKFIDFKKDLLILRYNYFKLKESLVSIDDISTNIETNPFLKNMNLRSIITKQNLENTIVKYEQILKKLFEKI